MTVLCWCIQRHREVRVIIIIAQSSRCKPRGPIIRSQCMFNSRTRRRSYRNHQSQRRTMWLTQMACAMFTSSSHRCRVRMDGVPLMEALPPEVSWSRTMGGIINELIHPQKFWSPRSTLATRVSREPLEHQKPTQILG